MYIYINKRLIYKKKIVSSVKAFLLRLSKLYDRTSSYKSLYKLIHTIDTILRIQSI